MTTEYLNLQDLKKIFSAIVTLAVKDLRACKAYIPSPFAYSEQIRTAWLLIFDNNYRIKMGNKKLSFIDMITIISGEYGEHTVADIRTFLGNELNCYPLK